MSDKAQTALRLSPDLLARAEQLVPYVDQDPLMRAEGQVTRSTVLRFALEHGLDALEQKHGVSRKPAPQAATPVDDWADLLSWRREATSTPTMDARAVAARILELRASGATLRAIAEMLSDEGVPTRRGGKWYASTVRAVLQRVE